MQSCVHRQWFSSLCSSQSQGQALREEWEEEGLLWQQGHYCFQATTPKKVSWFSASNIEKCPKLGSHNRNVYCLTVLEILPRAGSLGALWTLLGDSTLVSGSLMMFLDRWWLEGVFSPSLCLHLYAALHPRSPPPVCISGYSFSFLRTPVILHQATADVLCDFLLIHHICNAPILRWCRRLRYWGLRQYSNL